MGSRKVIGKQYLQGWFSVDLVSTVPFDSIVDLILWMSGDAGGGGTSSLSFLSLGRLLKLVRLMKLNKVLTVMEEEGRLAPSTVQLTQLTISIGLIGHMLACAWYVFCPPSTVRLSQLTLALLLLHLLRSSSTTGTWWGRRAWRGSWRQASL